MQIDVSSPSIIIGTFTSATQKQKKRNSIIFDPGLGNQSNSPFNRMEDQCTAFTSQINGMNMLQTHANSIYELCTDLLKNFTEMIDKMITHSDAIKLSTEFVASILCKHTTSYKRDKLTHIGQLFD